MPKLNDRLTDLLHIVAEGGLTSSSGKTNTACVAVFRKISGGPLEVLLSLRRFEPAAGQWSLPGGHQKNGETSEETAQRELQEETGLKPKEIVFVQERPGNAERSIVDYVFAAYVTPDIEVRPADDAGALRWFPMDLLPPLPFNDDQAILTAANRVFGATVATEHIIRPYAGLLTEAKNLKKTLSNILSSRSPDKPGLLIVFEGIDGVGKCFGRNTPILMFDGSIKKVQDIVIGDLLMGNDSTPRIVTSLARGTEMMYKVTPNKGDSYIVNESHILSVIKKTKHLKAERVLNISVRDYLRRGVESRRNWMGYRTGVDFRECSVRINPYILGLWLGDGHSNNTYFTTMDEEVVRSLYMEAKERKLSINVLPPQIRRGVTNRARMFRISGYRPGNINSNSLLNDLRFYNLMLPGSKSRTPQGSKMKHIPKEYLCNTREVRLQILAGLLDSDGSLAAGVNFEFINKNERLAEDVTYLARSLGLAAYIKRCQKKACNSPTGYIGVYYRVNISGDTNLIPTRIARKKATQRVQNKDVLHVGIKVTPIGEGEYFGFEITGNRLFLLGDFTVVHNSTQCDKLCSWLEKNDYVITRTKWNSSELMEKTIKKAKNDRLLSPVLYSLLHAADMIYRYEYTIIPALLRNEVVVCDRYFYTSLVRDKVRGMDVTIIEKLYENLREPDLLIHCVAPIEVAFSRLLGDKGLTYYGSGMDLNLASSKEENCIKYQQLMNKAYQKVMPKSEDYYYKLNMNRSVGTIAQDVKDKIGRLFGIGKYSRNR